jgi:hypothetical protein
VLLPRQDFFKAGKTWTADLCKKDSDGDGFTNGQELGDPDCKVGAEWLLKLLKLSQHS